jgi:hypothetical protein
MGEAKRRAKAGLGDLGGGGGWFSDLTNATKFFDTVPEWCPTAKPCTVLQKGGVTPDQSPHCLVFAGKVEGFDKSRLRFPRNGDVASAAATTLLLIKFHNHITHYGVDMPQREADGKIISYAMKLVFDTEEAAIAAESLYNSELKLSANRYQVSHGENGGHPGR